MNRKLRYPIEAFALAMVLFSSGMKTAMLVGIGLIFGDILQGVLGETEWRASGNAVSAVGGAVTAAAMYLMYTLVGITPGIRELAGFAALAILLMKHQEERMREVKKLDYNDMLFADTIAYIFYVIAAVLREYLSGAAIYGIQLPKLAVVSATFGKPMFALILTGIAIALVNRILRAGALEGAALWVCLPVMLFEVPFVLNHIPECWGTAVGIAAAAVIYLSLRSKFRFTDPEKSIEGIPVETVTLGMIYMIVSLL